MPINPSIVGLKNEAESKINPATEDAQLIANSSLVSIETDTSGIKTNTDKLDVNLSTRASETTLGLIKTQTDKLTFTSTALNVNITGGGSSGLTDTDDGSIAAGQIGASLVLNLIYGYNGATWERVKSSSNRLVVDGSQVTQPISAVSLPLPTGAATSAKQDTGNTSLSSIDGKLTSLGQKNMAGSVPVVIASDQSTINVKSTAAAVPTSTRSDVSRSNASQSLLASNASRKGATIFNDAAANLFVKFGTTASSSDFTIRLQSNDYYEVPFNYTGAIDGIWASNGTGAARITELS